MEHTRENGMSADLSQCSVRSSKRGKTVNLSRPRIKMQSYDGTFSVRRTSRSLNTCSYLSKRGVPAILRNARWYTEATIRRALNDGGVVCIEKKLRDSTNDNFSGAGMCPDQKCAKPVVHTLPSRTSHEHGRSAHHCRSPSQSFPVVYTCRPH